VRPTRRIHLPSPVSVALATVLYALSAAAVGLSTLPSALLVSWGVGHLLPAQNAGRLLLFCLLLGGALYLFFISCLFLLGVLMRLLSLVVRPGRHPLRSVTTVFWMAMNGVQTLALRLVLPVVPGGWLPVLYYRLAGCRIGRDVWITGVTIIDPALVSIADGTVIGGDVVISAHIAGGNDLYLGPIRIGKDCRIGAHAVICAGVVIGDAATLGVRAYLRKGRIVPPGAYVADLGGLSPRRVVTLQSPEGEPPDTDSL
jgi:acetyltransferase-like isoleucine patch superfamily enzyme